MAHYPHDPRWLDACDKAGIMVIHEVPHYHIGIGIKSEIVMLGDKLINNISRQLVETIERDRNHPSIVMWSIGNENGTFKYTVKNFHQKLYDLSKEVDPDKPVTFAISGGPMLNYLEVTAGVGDVIFLNEYFGWYYGEPEGISDYLDKIHKKYPDKPIVVSEFGAGSFKEATGEMYSFDLGISRDFTEDYQAQVYETQLSYILEKPYVTGTMPWVFADFQDDYRAKNPVQWFNLKGLVTHDREKKKAFYLFAEVYGKIKAEEAGQ
jgi:beta-galactosidase/beta-glucuronidase